MKKEILEAVNKDIEDALSQVEDMENSLAENPEEGVLKEKFEVLFQKVVNLEQMLKEEGII
jgi:transcription elongation factor GreA-like protein